MTSSTDDPKQEPVDDRQARQERAQRAASTPAALDATAEHDRTLARRTAEAMRRVGGQA